MSNTRRYGARRRSSERCRDPSGRRPSSRAPCARRDCEQEPLHNFDHATICHQRLDLRFVLPRCSPPGVVKKPTAAIDNPYANRSSASTRSWRTAVSPVTAMFQFCRRREAVRELKERADPALTTDPRTSTCREDDRGTRALIKFVEPVAPGGVAGALLRALVQQGRHADSPRLGPGVGRPGRGRGGARRAGAVVQPHGVPGRRRPVRGQGVVAPRVRHARPRAPRRPWSPRYAAPAARCALPSTRSTTPSRWRTTSQSSAR